MMNVAAPPPGKESASRPLVAYCVTTEVAKALVEEVIRDAAGRPAALDIETAPL